MDRPQEGALAWDLVDQLRDGLTDEERTTAFVHLGVGDYLPVFRCVLEAAARERLSLSPSMAAMLQAWIEDYDRHYEFEGMLAQAAGRSSTEAASPR